MALSTMAVSSTEQQMGPILSIVHESAIAQVIGTSPKVGRSPVVPQRVDGEEIEPSVSVPRVKPTHPAAVAAAEPAEDPLEPWSRLHGLRVMPPNHLSPIASAPRVSFAMRIAPARSRRETTVAS